MSLIYESRGAFRFADRMAELLRHGLAVTLATFPGQIQPPEQRR